MRLPARRRIAAALALAALAGPALAQGAPVEPARAQGTADEHGPASAERVASALARVWPALVNLTVVTERFGDGRALRGPGAGSGVVVTADGHVLTNFHVAGDSTRVTATLTSGEVLDAEVVAHDALTDLSVLRLRVERRAPGAPPLAPARFAERELEVGDTVLAMGNPLTLSSSVTLGIVSNARRVFTDFLGNEIEDLDLGDGAPTGLFTKWIQHDALILPGNSGGPLVDLDGELVGINELGGGGMGFAIPAAIARRVLERVLAEGRVRRAWLGLSVLPVGKLGRETGALVATVVPGSPAERAGVRAGDVLLAAAGRPVAVRFFTEVPDLYRELAELPAGSPVELEIERDGERRRLTATLEEMEEARGRQAEFRRLGLTAQELTAPMALARRLTPRSGALVTSLRAGFPAAGAKPPLQPGDLITALGGREVRGLDDLAAALGSAPAAEVLLTLRREDELLLSALRLVEPESARWGGELAKPWLGVRTQVVTQELARLLATPELRGFRVTEVYPWTEAARSGLLVGDVIVELDGGPLEARRPQDAENLEREIEARGIGDRVALGVVRGGDRLDLEVALEASPRAADEARVARQGELEFSVREIGFLDRVENHWPRDQAGVLVIEVTPGGWAQMGGLATGDLVLSVAGRPIADVAAFETEMRAVVAARPALIQVFVRRQWRTHFVFLEPEWPSGQAANGASR